MTRSRICISALIAFSVPLAHTEQDYLEPGSLYEAGLVKYWQLRLPLEADQSLVDTYLVDDQLYLGTRDGYLYAVDAYTGVVRWFQPVTRSGYRLQRPCHLDDRTILVTPVDIQVYDRRTGQGILRQQLRFPSGTAPITDGYLLFVGGLDNRLYAFDAETLWIDWRLYLDGPVSATPAFFDRVYGEDRKIPLVFAATNGGGTWAATRYHKRFQWRAQTLGPVTADVIATEAGVYVASQDRSLYLFDVEVGRTRWQARFSAPLREAPFVTDDVAYQYSAGDGIVAVETRLDYEIQKRVRWTLPQGRRVLATDEDSAYILSQADELLVVRIADGAVQHTIPAAGFKFGIRPVMPADDPPTIFLAASDGRLFCARPPSVPPLTRQDILDATRPVQVTEEGESAAKVETRESPVAAGRNPLEAARRGRPIGGKSKVTKRFQEQSQSE